LEQEARTQAHLPRMAAFRKTAGIGLHPLWPFCIMGYRIRIHIDDGNSFRGGVKVPTGGDGTGQAAGTLSP